MRYFPGNRISEGLRRHGVVDLENPKASTVCSLRGAFGARHGERLDLVGVLGVVAVYIRLVEADNSGGAEDYRVACNSWGRFRQHRS